MKLVCRAEFYSFRKRFSTRKIWQIMRLTVMLLIICCLKVSAASYGQNITLSVKNVPLEKVLNQIRKKTGYVFFYRMASIKSAIPVTVELNNMPVDKAMGIILKGQLLSYVIENKTITIVPKPNYPIDRMTNIVPMETIPDLTLQLINIHGKVMDSAGNPLGGVSVALKGLQKGTITDAKGTFSLSDIEPSATLIFSCVGYETKQINIDGKTSLLITLTAKFNSLEDIVTVGYGTEKKIDLTGAVDQISGAKIENRPVPNIADALQGMMANLNITTNSSGGTPDATKSINVRGYTGYASGSNLAGPLILIDGVPSDINSINTNDVESITLLKDAAASAIYGSRAPNGVLLITTKQGKLNQPMQVSYNNNFSINNPIGLPHMMNSYDFANLYNEASVNGNQGLIFPQSQLKLIKQYLKDPSNVPTMTPSADSLSWTNSVANTDWYNVYMKKNVFSQQHNLSLTGGSEKLTYFLGLGYVNQNGNLNFFHGETYKRYNFRANVNANINRWIKIGMQSSYSLQDDKIPYAHDIGYNLFYDIAREWPIGSVMDPNGNGYVDYMASELASDRWWQKDQKNDAWIKGVATITPLEGWEIHADYAYNYFSEPYSNLIGNYTISTPLDPHTMVAGTDSYTETNYNNHYHSYNIYSSYEKTIKGHYFKAMVGQQEEYQYYSSLTGYNTNLYDETNPSLSLTYGTNTSTSDSKSAWATYGTFGRLNYNYKEKYLLEANGRYMGTSLFPSDDRYHFFTSISAGWNISNESFFSPLKNVIDNLKLRASYGGTGDITYFINQGAYYPYLSTLTTTLPGNTSWVFSPTGTREPAVGPPGLVSPDITWAKPSMLDIGLDLRILKDFNITFDWYQRTIKDLFGPGATYPSTLGTTPPQENNATTVTTGFDLTANWSHQLGKFLLTARATLSNYSGKITKYSGNSTNGLGDWYQGESQGTIWGYKTVGKFQSDAQVANAPSQTSIAANWFPGDIQYADLNHDGKIDYGNYTLKDHGDLTIIGNTTPKYNYGLNVGTSYKGIDLYVFFQGVGGGKYFPQTNVYWGVVGTDLYHAPPLKTMYDRWTPTNPDGYFPRAQFGSSQDIQTQSGYLVSLAYLRLKNLQVGYTIPSNLIKRWHLSKIRFYASLENVFTIAPELKHSYIDPEELTSGERIYPLMRTFSFGAQINIL